MRNLGRWILAGYLYLCAFPAAALASNSVASSCAQEFEPFISQMLKNIPIYVNRVNTRADNSQSYLLMAGRADFEALPISRTSFPNADSAIADVRQVFFSTVVKRIDGQKVVHHQEHHWLMMTPSDRGWEFVQMYSVIDSYPSQNLPSAPRDSSEGAMATAIKDWLKACHYQAKS
ncbi:MAG: hypothetical protein AAGB01_10290 [Cyanobacteria bacterium P01_F01_bin.42]